jgi:hypothetical protein
MTVRRNPLIPLAWAIKGGLDRIKRQEPPAKILPTMRQIGFQLACYKCWPKVSHEDNWLQASTGELCDMCFHREPNASQIVKSEREEFWSRVAVDKDFRRKMKAARGNPSLLILSNPEAVPGEAVARKAWSRFHLREGRAAKVTKVPDVSGLPKTVVVLGACEGFEWVPGPSRRHEKVFKFKRDMKNGPWLVTDIAAKRLWIVASKPSQLAKCPNVGCFKAIYYYPPSNSGKHDKDRGYRHEHGEGGKLPKSRWPEAYPDLMPIGDRAIELVRPKRNGYIIEGRGIVG